MITTTNTTVAMTREHETEMEKYKQTKSRVHTHTGNVRQCGRAFSFFVFSMLWAPISYLPT